MRTTPPHVRRAARLWAPLGAVLVAAGCHSGQTIPGTVELPETKPVLLDCPGYTSPRLGERGLVGAQLRVQVGEDGRPMAVTPIQGPSPIALEEATQLARGCIFEPARQAGEPVTAWTRLLFRFNEIVVR